MKTKHKLAIHELLSRAAHYFDARDAKGLEACFIEDAQMRVNIGEDQKLGPFEGRDGIMALIHSTWDAQDDVRRHIICDIFFESESAIEATVVSTVVVASVTPEDITLVTTGVYRDRVQKIGSDWLIADRQLDLDKSF